MILQIWSKTNSMTERVPVNFIILHIQKNLGQSGKCFDRNHTTRDCKHSPNIFTHDNTERT